MNGLVYGIDLGITSCGWAVLRHPTCAEPTGEIVDMGSWMFDVSETAKERTPPTRSGLIAGCEPEAVGPSQMTML